MKKDERKELYVCKQCEEKVIGCFNILSKDSGVPCEACKVKDNCTMRKHPMKYMNLFTIKKMGLCDKCYYEVCRQGHA